MNIDMAEVLHSAAEYLKECSGDCSMENPVKVDPELVECLKKASDDVMDEISRKQFRVYTFEQ